MIKESAIWCILPATQTYTQMMLLCSLIILDLRQARYACDLVCRGNSVACVCALAHNRQSGLQLDIFCISYCRISGWIDSVNVCNLDYRVRQWEIHSPRKLQCFWKDAVRVVNESFFVYWGQNLTQTT